MKRRVLSMLERTLADVRDVIAAIEADDVDLALAKFAEISERLDTMAGELRAEVTA